MLDAIALAFALAMDATAVSAARSVSGIRVADALRMAILFGLFQGGMAAIGWLAGTGAERAFGGWDHWIAAALLAGIGVKMLVDGIRAGGGGATEEAKSPRWSELLVLAVATSIDALLAGVTLPLLAVREVISIALIAGVTFALSLVGARAGRALGARFGARLGVLGGVALLGLAVRIVIAP